MSRLFRRTVDLAAIPLEIVDGARALFDDLDWEVEVRDDEDSLFDMFCAMLAMLNEEERSLVTTISRDFLRCILSIEENAIRDVIRALDALGVGSAAQFYAAPMVKPEDHGKVKSGPAALYMLRALLEVPLKQAGLQPVFLPKLDRLERSRKARKGAFVLLFDDYIGSGGTAREVVELYRAKYSNASDRLVVGALVAQAEAVEALGRAGVEVVAPIVRSRGISDSVRITDKPTAIDLMRALSARVGENRPEHQLGWESTEALIVMRRCPNNTFPVFRSTRDARGAQWPAPFPR